MSFKVRTSCLIILLLLLAVFGLGTASAAEIDGLSEDNSFDFRGNPFENEFKHLLDYNVTIYVTGDTVTVVNNFENTGFPVRKVNSVTSGNLLKQFNVSKPNIVQFNYSDLCNTDDFKLNADDEFTLYLCGSFSSDTTDKSTHIDQEITFKVEEIIMDDDVSDDETNSDNEAKTVKTIIYPVRSGFINDFGKGSEDEFYYRTFYGSVFDNKNSDNVEAVYPDLKEELVDKAVIYSFDQGNLRFIYWFDTEADELKLKESGHKDISPYEPEFVLDLSHLQDFKINSLFICPEHDTYSLNNNALTISGTSCSDCSSDILQVVTVGDSEKEASDYLLSYLDLYPEETDENDDSDEDFSPEDGQESETDDVIVVKTYPHFVSFNSSALNADLLKKKVRLVQFYPILNLKTDTDDSGQQQPDETDEDDLSFVSFKDQAYVFKFSRPYKPIAIELTGNTLDLVSETTDYSKPLVSSLLFPDAIKDALNGNHLLIENLNSHVLDDAEDDEGHLTPETAILSVTDISFENSINEVLKENNEQVEISFVIPVDDVELNPNDIAVLHVSDDGEKKSLEKLESTVSFKIDGVKYYSVTAKTSEFSSFAVISTGNPDSGLSSNAGGQPIGEAFVVSQENSVPPTDVNGYDLGLSPSPISVVEDIVTKIQGHLSIFSVLVVLTSGLFMWDYIRRRV